MEHNKLINGKYEYFAFISYKEEDAWWAKWLQRKLEHYKLPTSLRKENPNLPERISPIYEYKSEAGGGRLKDSIWQGLTSSKYLIVICSTRATRSEWINNGIHYFVDSGQEVNIIPFIIEGTPKADNPDEECFPTALRELTGDRELRGININEMGRDAAAVKVVSRMFDLKFDVLWQRYEREKKKTRWLLAGMITIFSVLAISVSGIIWHQNVRLKEKDRKMMINQSRYISEEASNLVNNGDSYMAQRILLEVIIDKTNKSNKPYTIESERILRKASSVNSAVLHNHSGPVNYVSISPDGTTMVTASGDSTLLLWDIESGDIINKMTGHGASVCTADFNHDGTKIVSSSFDKSARIWDAKSGKTIRILSGHQSYVNSAFFSPDGGKIVSASGDGTLKIWDVLSGENTQTVLAHDNSVNFAIFSPDGKRIASASRDAKIKMWDTESGGLICSMNGHTASVNSIAFSPNGELFASASDDHTVRVWDAETGKGLSVLKCHASPVWSVSFSRDGQRLVSASVDKTLKIYNVDTGVITDSLKGHSSYVYSASFTNDGQNIVSSSRDNTVRIWDLRKCSALLSIEGNTNSFSPDGEQFIVTSKRNEIKIYNIISGELVDNLSFIDSKANYSYYCPNGQNIITSCKEKTDIWNIEKQQRVHSFDGSFLAISPDNKIVVTNSFDLISGRFVNTLRFWDINTGDLIHFHKSETYVNSVSFAPNGKKFVIATDGNTLELYDAITHELLKSIRGHSSDIYSVSYSKDGKRIVSASNDGTIKVWDANSFSEILLIKGHSYRIHSVSFSPDGKRLVSASGDKTIKIWDSETGDNLETLTGHKSEVVNASFSPDGKYIVSSSDDGITKIWSSPPFDTLIDEIYERFKKVQLTIDEKRKYYIE